MDECIRKAFGLEVGGCNRPCDWLEFGVGSNMADKIVVENRPTAD